MSENIETTREKITTDTEV